MRIGGTNDYAYLASLSIGFSRVDPQGAKPSASSSDSGSYTVNISREARESYEAYALGTKKTQKGDSTRDDFLQYMEDARTAPKSKEKQIKELKGKLEKLKAELSKVAEDKEMPEEVKGPKMEALNTQIQQVMKDIAEMSTDLAKETASEPLFGSN